MKKIFYIVMLFVMMISVPVMAGSYKRSSSSSSECIVGGCHARRYNGLSYCREHKCCIYDCMNKCGSDGMYCSTHHNKYYREMKNHYIGKSSSSSKNRSNSGSSSSRRSGSGSSSRRSGSSSNSGNSKRRSSSSSGSSSRKTIDPDDYDIEAYYEDNWDEYEDYDDAYDGFMDDEDAWDDYE